MKYIHKNHSSKLTTIVAAFGAGSRVEFNSKYPYGIAHFMEHVRFKGTEEYDSKTLTRTVAFNGGVSNAFTSTDMVAYHISVPEDNIEAGFKILSQIALHPTFPQEELTKEQEVVCQEIRMYEDDMGNNVWYGTLGKVFSNSIANNVAGTEASVKNITRQHLLDFNKEFYSKNQMLVITAGQHSYDDLVNKYFGSPDGVFDYKSADKVQEYPAPFELEVTKEGELQDTIMVSFAGNNLAGERHINKVFEYVFGASDDSRLFTHVRDELGLVYGIGGSLAHHTDGDIFSISTETDPKNRQAVIQGINKVIDDMILIPPTEEELQRAKNRIKSSEYRRLDSSNGMAMYLLNSEIYGYDNSAEFIEKVNAVSVQQVFDRAKQVFANNKYLSIGTRKI